MECGIISTTGASAVTIRVWAARCTNVQCGSPCAGDPSFLPSLTLLHFHFFVETKNLVSSPVLEENVSVVTINVSCNVKWTELVLHVVVYLIFIADFISLFAY